MIQMHRDLAAMYKARRVEGAAAGPAAASDEACWRAPSGPGRARSAQKRAHSCTCLRSSSKPRPLPGPPPPRCAEIDASTSDPLHHRAALMHVAMERAEAVVTICLPGAHSDAVARANVVRLDPPSAGVFIDRVQPISLDVGLNDLSVHFSGAEEVGGRGPGCKPRWPRDRRRCARSRLPPALLEPSPPSPRDPPPQYPSPPHLHPAASTPTSRPRRWRRA
jgi:hypothetical protein